MGYNKQLTNKDFCQTIFELILPKNCRLIYLVFVHLIAYAPLLHSHQLFNALKSYSSTKTSSIFKLSQISTPLNLANLIWTFLVVCSLKKNCVWLLSFDLNNKIKKENIYWQRSIWDSDRSSFHFLCDRINNFKFYISFIISSVQEKCHSMVYPNRKHSTSPLTQ